MFDRMIQYMHCQRSHVVATLVLLTCLVCPLAEMFDHWDHTLQTGNDTEYALVVLALCIGVAYSFARFIFKAALFGFVVKRVFASWVLSTLPSTPRCFILLFFDATGPPLLPLRI